MDDDIQRLLESERVPDAFALVVERYKEKVFRLAYSMLHDPTEAEDASQDALVKIWRALPGYRNAASLSTWIYTIARNTCLTELRRRSRHQTVSFEEPGMEPVAAQALQSLDPDSSLEMDVCTLLAELPERYRHVITLFYLEGKSYEETAAMLGLPLGTLKTLLFRGRKELLKIGARHLRPARAGLSAPEAAAVCAAAAARNLHE